MVMGMARGLGDGLLRLCNGAWRDNDGDAVDIVEVVRCKDCVYNENGCCTHSESYDDTRYRPDYFCADGYKRMDGDGNA